MKKTHKIGGTNVLLTVLLFLGCLTVLFPLYMTVMIAFKSPTEMTNDIAGALSFPSTWNFSNFSEAMRVTNFWHSLGNSFLITAVTIVLAVLLHSMAGYAIGRNMARKKGYKLIYFYIVSGMFVPFAILMMPLVKQTATMGLDNRLGVIILYLVFYMPMNVMLYSGYLKNVPLAMEEAANIDGASTWKTYWTIIFPMMKPMCLTLGSCILTQAGMAADDAAARAMLEQTITDGSALKKLAEFVAAQDGDPAAIYDPSRLPMAPVQMEVPSPASGYVRHIAATDVGLVSMRLGGGRATKDSVIDHSVGIVLRKKVDEPVTAGESLATIHAADEAAARRAVAELAACYTITPDAPPAEPFIKAIIR